MNDTIYQATALIIPLVIAIVFHEIAHGWVARACGDPTASEMGRLSLNPLKHVDLFGTIVLPGILKLAGLPIFGWAKPVPVVAQRMRNPRRDMMLVGAAGPAMNLAMGLGAAVLLGLVLLPYAGAQNPTGIMAFIVLSLLNFIQLNIFLACFNLLPVPPFDGSHIVEGLLPRAAVPAYAAMRPFALPLMIALLVFLPKLGPKYDVIGRLVVPPVQWLTEAYLSVTAAILG